MKRWLSILLAVLALMTMTACGDSGEGEKTESKRPSMDPSEYVAPAPLVYTELPQSLKAEKVGSFTGEVKTADGGLYYQEGEKYGIMTLDGMVDSGPIYAICQPQKQYFAVSKTVGDSANATSLNVVGLVDALGREVIPQEFASIQILGERFARVAVITGTTKKEEEKLTQITVDDKTVLCKGVWYLYDLKTGQPVPGATGTKPYISFDCGGYVKYVLDDKTVVVATPDGKALPEEPLHLKNGYYAIASTRTVYTSEGQQLFTYDAQYTPVESESVKGYIVAEKQKKGKKTYVLLDEKGQVASAEFDHQPEQYGALFHVGTALVQMDGTPVIESGCCTVSWEPIYGQSWAVDNGKTTQVVDKTGRVLFENKATGTKVETKWMMSYKTGSEKRYYYSAKDKGYTVGGVGLAPFLVKKANGDKYDVVNVLGGEAILTGYADYTMADAGDTLVYLYAKKADGNTDVFVVR